MASPTPTPDSDPKLYCLINYSDPYVQPLILSAIASRLPPSTYHLITSLTQLPHPSSRLLQWTQYESLDFTHLTSYPTTSTANAYIIRKALIRKHYLSTTIANWITKYPDSLLRWHVKPSVEFEVDYAEFLEDALVEAWDLKESWDRGVGRGRGEREWWILKPGMSEGGQGIRLFSNEEELMRIFEGWDPDSDEDDEDEDTRSDDENAGTERAGNPIMTSHLRHFIAQPYIHPPLLLSPTLSSPPRKFHIRTYILAHAALKIYVYKPMLALFAAAPYAPPWETSTTNDNNTNEQDLKAHLTNTCLQNSTLREGSVASFWSLPDSTDTTTPLPPNWKSQTFTQICNITSQTFLAAARSMSIHFQPLPNAFEIFGLDFMLSVEEDGELRTWLLEVNAFPDFRQTGEGLRGLVEGLFEGVVDVVLGGKEGDEEGLVKVLDVDLGRR